MLIFDLVNAHCQTRDLVPFEADYRETRTPTSRFFNEPRELYLAPAIYDCLEPPGEYCVNECGDPDRWDTVGADLVTFVEGNLLNVRRLGYDRDSGVPAHMVRLMSRGADEPSGIWEVRVTDLDFQMRLFGAFAAWNVFVALTWRDRDDLDFGDAMRDCASEWVRLFGFLPPHEGGFPNGYLSNTNPVPR
jgi:hypothetical protein